MDELPAEGRKVIFFWACFINDALLSLKISLGVGGRMPLNPPIFGEGREGQVMGAWRQGWNSHGKVALKAFVDTNFDTDPLVPQPHISARPFLRSSRGGGDLGPFPDLPPGLNKRPDPCNEIIFSIEGSSTFGWLHLLLPLSSNGSTREIQVFCILNFWARGAPGYVVSVFVWNMTARFTDSLLTRSHPFPCPACIVFVFVVFPPFPPLSQTGKVHFGYIFGMGMAGCISLFLLLNVMSEKVVDFQYTVSTLGYCLCPTIILGGWRLLAGIGLNILPWCAVCKAGNFFNIYHARSLLNTIS